MTATGARAWLQFHTALAPGINGAYYFVQARAVLETGVPGVPDLPFTFYLHAAIAGLAEHLGGMSREAAIVLAVKGADAFLPALAALPIGWLSWRWQRSQPQPSVIAAIAPAALVCLGAQALGMVGDFQKNSLALVWLAALGPAAHVFLGKPGWRTALLPLGLMALLGLTHVGVLGTALVFAGILACVALATATPELRRRLAMFALIGAGVFAIAGVVIYKAYDPARVTRLIKAFSDPSSFTESKHPGGFGDANRRGVMPPPSDAADHVSATNRLGSGGPDRGRGFPGGPPGMGLLRWLPATAFLTLSGIALLTLWTRRKNLPAADRSVLLAAALTSALVGGPFFDMDKAQRLILIAVVPAAMTLSFLLASVSHSFMRRALGGLVLAGSIASAALYLPHGGQPNISEETFAELRSLAPFASPAGRTLIVARHGLEWWTAWALHTHIAQPTAVNSADWKKFDRVLYLVEKQGHGPLGGGRPFGIFQGDRRPRDSDANSNPPDDFGPPPDRAGGRGDLPPPPDRMAMMRGGPGGGGPGGGPFSNRIPDNARILHDGPQLKLAQADEPPDELGADGFAAMPPR